MMKILIFPAIALQLEQDGAKTDGQLEWWGFIGYALKYLQK
jgi:hypothetical protein